MSEKKKVIYVKDLVIKADNVIIEPQHDHHRQHGERVDPFFGGRRHQAAEGEESSSHHDEESKDRRGGFSWF